MPSKCHDVHLECPLKFAASPRPSLLLRLTPLLREALLEAHVTGERASIKLGETGQSTVITVGSQIFEAASTPEGTCELVKLPPAGSGLAATEVGVVQQKLLVKRRLSHERNRQNSATQSKANIKQTSVLIQSSAAGAAALPYTAGPTTHEKARSASPAAARPNPTRPTIAKQPSPAGSLEAGSQPISKRSQPKSKLGLPRAAGKSSQAGATAAVLLSAEVLQRATAAAQLPDKKRALRLCLIALLAPKPITRKKLEQAVAEVRRSVVAFKPTLDQWRGEAGRISEYRAPGVYHLHPGLIAELAAAVPMDDAAMGGQSVLMPNDKLPGEDKSSVPCHQQPQQHEAGPQQQDEAAKRPQEKPEKPPMKRLRKADSTADPAPTDQTTPAVKAKAKAKKQKLDRQQQIFEGKSLLAAAEADDPTPACQHLAAADASEHMPVEQQGEQVVPTGISSGSHASMPLASVQRLSVSPEEGSISGNARSRIKSRSSSLAGTSGLGAGSSCGNNVSAGENSNASRSSPRYDEAWFGDYARREPVLAPPCVSQSDFEAYRDVYQSKYGVYFRLHQELQAHKREMSGLRDAASSAAADSPQRGQWLAQLELLWRRRRNRCLRWEAAHSVLHTELQSIKGALRQYTAEQQTAMNADPLHVSTSVASVAL